MLTRRSGVGKTRGMMRDAGADSERLRDRPDVDVAIIGAGFGGLCMAIRLQSTGLRFVILEKESEPGGTWYQNSYPGCACDVPSHLYSYSFEPNPSWTRSYSRQPEILDYLKHCVDKYGLGEHLRLATTVDAIRYEEGRGMWRVRIRGGEELSARVVVAGTGALSVPNLPAIPGRDDFRGHVFHSQGWDHAHALRGKRVAVIGTGASAIQFIPQIAEDVAELTVFQRSPPWVLPKWDRHIGPRMRRMFAALPWTQRLNRLGLYWFLESRAIGFLRWHFMLRAVGWLSRQHLRRQVADDALREVLTPDYAFGCKRVLLSNDYYPAMARPNVRLVDSPVARMTRDGIESADGRTAAADVIIFGTGFRASDPYPRGFITGRRGLDIVDAWRDGPEAYLGTAVSGFPNLFFLGGPNTGLGHSSMVFMLESQVAYIMTALEELAGQGAAALEVRDSVQRRYNSTLRERLARTIWLRGGCSSWYLSRNGRNVALWPGFTWQFRRLTRRIRPEDFTIERARSTRESP